MVSSQAGADRTGLNSADVIIKPVCLRFSLYEGNIYYHFAAQSDAQLDSMERLMGINPAAQPEPADINLGFLPVASTVLIRGEKNIIVDPGSHHIGYYGILGRALKDAGVGFDEIDTVVVTHWHHDHFCNAGLFDGAELVIGEGELDFGSGHYGVQEVGALTARMGRITSVSNSKVLCRGVTVVHTPGHTPGSICVIAETESGRVAIPGDTVMTARQFARREFSHWYSPEEKRLLRRSLDRILEFCPSGIIPGHDGAFEVKPGNQIE